MPLSTNLMMSYINRFDQGTLSGGSWQVAAPLSNLQVLRQGKVARSLDALAASTKFEVDLGSSLKVIRMIMIAKHNISTAGQIRIRAGSSPGLSDVLDTGFVDVWPPVYAYTDLAWEDPNFYFGSISSEEAASYPIKIIKDLGANYLARYWGIEINDTSNAAGYVELTRLWGGPAFIPIHNYDFGHALQWESRDDAEESYGGARYVTRRRPRRVFDFKLHSLNDSEAYGRALEIQRLCGSEGEVIIIPDRSTTAQWHRRNVHGRIRRLDPIQNALLNVNTAGFEIEEFIL